LKKYFLFVGPQKTASTWIYDILNKNSMLKFPKKTKETFFWDRFYDRGLEWYLEHFDDSDKIISEVGPTYFSSEETIERVYKYNKNTKVIITLRDPANRAFSMYLHHLKKGRYNVPFWEAVKLYPEIIESSHYKKYINMWSSQFGNKNIIIILQEEIKTDSLDVVTNLCEFLGIPIEYNQKMLNRKSNEASMPKYIFLAGIFTKISLFIRKLGLYSIVNFANNIGIKKLIYSSNKQIPKLDKQLRKELIEIFYTDIEYIEKIKNKNLENWKNYE
jgi:hypothetical protein